MSSSASSSPASSTHFSRGLDVGSLAGELAFFLRSAGDIMASLFSPGSPSRAASADAGSSIVTDGEKLTGAGAHHSSHATPRSTSAEQEQEEEVDEAAFLRSERKRIKAVSVARVGEGAVAGVGGAGEGGAGDLTNTCALETKRKTDKDCLFSSFLTSVGESPFCPAAELPRCCSKAKLLYQCKSRGILTAP